MHHAETYGDVSEGNREGSNSEDENGRVLVLKKKKNLSLGSYRCVSKAKYGMDVFL